MPTRLAVDDSKLQRVFSFVVEYKSKHDGVAPSLMEIGAALELDPFMVRYYLRHLCKQGVISMLDGKSRSIMVSGGVWTAPKM